MKKVELLAPAGSIEALKAAISSGADAVYLGGSQFGARAFAKNFDEEEIVSAIALAHFYQVKIYVTLNTLVYDHEFQQVMDYVDFLYHNDVDALIIQDLGLMRAIRTYYPDLELHASTQMTVHNAPGALLLKEVGIKRVVLARENTLAEIKLINEQVGIETEVFVHGALCVSYSGQCLMSSLIGGRSGNRGKCAQPCRKLYDLALNDEVIETNKYLISPKDLNTIKHLDEIIESGVTSLKIEGRMKSPEYVAIVVSIYRKAIDQYYENKQINISSIDLSDLEQIFNRQFTKGFLFNENGNAYINTERNNNIGVLCGIVEGSSNNQVKIKCLKEIHLLDGIYFEETSSGLTVSRMIMNGKEIKEAKIGDLITIDVKESVATGVKVYKTKDVLLEEKAKNISLKKIGLNAEVSLLIGQKAKMKVSDDLGHQVETEIDFIVQESKGQALSESKISNQLNKLGNTPFYFENLAIIKDETIFIAMGALNELRRQVTNELIQIRQKWYNRELLPKYTYQKENKTIDKGVALAIYCTEVDQVKAALACNVQKIYVNEDIINEINTNHDHLYCVKRRVNTAPVLNGNFKNQVVSDLGTLYLSKGITEKMTTNFNLNVTNSETIKFLKEQQATLVTLSYEINEAVYRNLLYEDKSLLEIIVYGYQEAMVTKYCMFKGVCKNQCQKKHYYLIDSKKEKFRVNMDKACHMHIYNSKNLILTDEVLKLMKYGYQNFRLQFSNEDYDETVNVIKAYQTLIFNKEKTQIEFILDQYKKDNMFTRGYYNKISE